MKKANRRPRQPGLCSAAGAPRRFTIRYCWEAFRLAKEGADLSKHTIKHYEKTIVGAFIPYCHQHAIEEIADVTATLIRGFFAHLKAPKEEGGRAFAPSNVMRNAVDLKVFLSWLTREKENGSPLMSHWPLENVELPKHQEEVLPPFTDDEIEKLYNACKPSGAGMTEKQLNEHRKLRVRDKALLLVMLDTAARREGCELMRIKHLDLSEGTILVHNKGRRDTYTARLSPPTVTALRRYLGLDTMADVKPEDPLWWGKHGSLTYHGVGEVIDDICERAKVQGSCHKLRRTAAIRMLRQGANLKHVQKLLGHADFQVINRYLKYVDGDYKDAHAKFSPVASLPFLKEKRSFGKRRRAA